MHITLHIERVVLDRLDGLPLASRETAVVEAGIRAELTRLLTAHGVGRAVEGGAVASLAAQVVPHARQPGALGTQIARGAYRAVAGGSARS